MEKIFESFSEFLNEQSEELENQLVKFENSNGDKMVGLITKFELNDKTDGFRISFRLYNMTQENGGFETSLWISNAHIGTAKMFVGPKYDSEHVAKMIGAKITSYKTDNKVGVKFQFDKIKSKLQ